MASTKSSKSSKSTNAGETHRGSYQCLACIEHKGSATTFEVLYHGKPWKLVWCPLCASPVDLGEDWEELGELDIDELADDEPCYDQNV